jgi:hypothetical protein
MFVLFIKLSIVGLSKISILFINIRTFVDDVIFERYKSWGKLTLSFLQEKQTVTISNAKRSFIYYDSSFLRCRVNCLQRTGLYAGWELAFRLPGPLLIENILLKVRTNAQRCLSSPN